MHRHPARPGNTGPTCSDVGSAARQVPPTRRETVPVSKPSVRRRHRTRTTTCLTIISFFHGIMQLATVRAES